MQARFISFEGPEGSGKSTQVGLLREFLEGQGLSVLTTREPGGTPTGELIREILQHDRAGEPVAPETEALLFAASRAQHVAHVIRPALEAGTWVLCDRFVDSSIVYQGVARGLGVDAVRAINDFALAGILPDQTLLLDLDVETGAARMRRRSEETGDGPDRFEQEDRAFHEQVRAGYLELAAREPGRYVILDAAQEAGTLADAIATVIKPFIS